MLCIQEELGVLGSRVGSPLENGLTQTDGTTLEESVENMPNLDENHESNGWMDGLLGCLQPVWKIIGKATGNELKSHLQGNEFFLFSLFLSWKENFSKVFLFQTIGKFHLKRLRI